MSMRSAMARRDPLPALPLRRVLHLDTACRELRPQVVGLPEITRGACRRPLVEPALFLGIGCGHSIPAHEREHTEDAVDLFEQMLQRALRRRRDRARVEETD